ncbi:MAG: divergent polysaccharide deacetylase family protein [Elusimicrobia bacterium]|nr:divergent polysaccharide deacetylase family protein [Elusimicrobiota bacterium]
MRVLLSVFLLSDAWAAGPGAAGPGAAGPGAAEPPAQKPRIAVVLDDFGLTYKKNVPDDKWMALKWPATFAVMPSSPLTKSAAKAALASGHELIIHFPFDPFLRLELPKDRVSPADLDKVTKLWQKCLSDIPGAVGVNNHRSEKATRNRPLMEAFMGLVKAQGMYFVDSWVSPKSVAKDEAAKAGLKTGRGTVFIDEAKRHDKAFCVRMLRRAATHARKHGWAIAIGHHYFQGTYDCLAEEAPKLQAEGFEFVPASAVVR